MSNIKKNVPELRFPGFEGEWEVFTTGEIFRRIKRPVSVELDKKYYQIGIRSHGKGIFYKPGVTGRELGNKSVFWIEPDVFIVNIVFAWERAVSKTTIKEKGMIASHRFPMFKPNPEILNLDFIEIFFKTNLGKYKLQLASPGGAGRNKTLGQKEFSKLKLLLPTVDEQKKIVKVISAIESKINILFKKKELMKQYKKGFMQKVFSQEIRFKDYDGNDYPDWEEKKLGEAFVERSERGNNSSELLSVTINNGVIRRRDIESKDNSSNNKSNYKIVKKGDFVYNSMRMWQGASGISKYDGIVSPAYTVCIPNTSSHNVYFSYLFKWKPIVFVFQRHSQGLTSDTWNCKYPAFSSIRIDIPSEEEQKKIANFLSSIDDKISLIDKELSSIKEFKKGLLQKIFV